MSETTEHKNCNDRMDVDTTTTTTTLATGIRPNTTTTPSTTTMTASTTTTTTIAKITTRNVKLTYREIEKDELIPLTSTNFLPLRPIGRIFFGLATSYCLHNSYKKIGKQKEELAVKKATGNDIDASEEMKYNDFDKASCDKTLKMLLPSTILRFCWDCDLQSMSKKFKPFFRMIKKTSKYIADLIPIKPLDAQNFLKKWFLGGLSVDQICTINDKNFFCQNFIIPDSVYLEFHGKIQHTFWYPVLFYLNDIGILPQAFDNRVDQPQVDAAMILNLERMIRNQHTRDTVYNVQIHEGKDYAESLLEEEYIFGTTYVEPNIWKKIKNWHNTNMENRSTSQKTIYDYFKQTSESQKEQKEQEQKEPMNVDAEQINPKKRSTFEQNSTIINQEQTMFNKTRMQKNTQQIPRSEVLLQSLKEKTLKQLTDVEQKQSQQQEQKPQAKEQQEQSQQQKEKEEQQEQQQSKQDQEMISIKTEFVHQESQPPESVQIISLISSSASEAESENDPVTISNLGKSFNTKMTNEEQKRQQQPTTTLSSSMLSVASSLSSSSEKSPESRTKESFLILAAITKPTSPLDAIEKNVKPFKFSKHIFYADICRLNNYMRTNPNRYQSLNKANKLLFTFPSLPRNAANLKSLFMKVCQRYEKVIKAKYGDSVGGEDNLAFRGVAECYPDRYYDVEKYPTISSRCHIHFQVNTTKNRKISLKVEDENFYHDFHQKIKYKAIDIELCKQTKEKKYCEKTFTFRPHVSLNHKRWNNIPDQKIKVHYPPDEKDQEQNDKLRAAMKEYEQSGLDSTLHKKMAGFVASKNKLKSRFFYQEYRSDNYLLILENKTFKPRRMVQGAFDDSCTDQSRTRTPKNTTTTTTTTSLARTSSSLSSSSSGLLSSLKLKTKPLPIHPSLTLFAEQTLYHKQHKHDSSQYRVWRRKLLVHKSGQIFNLRTRKQIWGSKQSKGYLQIQLEGKKHLVHRIVAEAWYPEDAKKFPIVHHINRQKRDNRACNLKWTTKSKNNIDRVYKKPSPNRPTLIAPQTISEIDDKQKEQKEQKPQEEEQQLQQQQEQSQQSQQLMHQQRNDDDNDNDHDIVMHDVNTANKNENDLKNDDDNDSDNDNDNDDNEQDINDDEKNDFDQIDRPDHDVFAQFRNKNELSASYFKKKRKHKRQELRRRSSERLAGLSGDQRLKELKKIEDERTENPVYEMDVWKSIAKDYEKDVTKWNKPSFIQNVTFEIKERFPYAIAQQTKINQFTEHLKDKSEHQMLTERRSHDRIQLHDNVIKIFKLKTLVRRNEPNWVVKVAHWIDNIVKHSNIDRGVGHKAKNLWIWGPPNYGKSESIVNRIQHEWPVWIIEKSTAHWTLPKPHHVFGILEEARNLKRDDLSTFKDILDGSNAAKQLRGLYQHKQVTKVPPVIITSNYSMKDWLKEINASGQDCDAMNARFMEIHANEPAIYGLFWQSHNDSFAKKGWQFNVQNMCANKIIEEQKLQNDPYVDISEEIDGATEQAWKQLIDEGKIPVPISQDLIDAGSKNIKPKLELYNAYLIMKDHIKNTHGIIYSPEQFKNDNPDMETKIIKTKNIPNVSNTLSKSNTGSSTIVPSQMSDQDEQEQEKEKEEKAHEMEIVHTDDGVNTQTRQIEKIDLTNIDIDIDMNEWPDSDDDEKSINANDNDNDDSTKQQKQLQSQQQNKEKNVKISENTKVTQIVQEDQEMKQGTNVNKPSSGNAESYDNDGGDKDKNDNPDDKVNSEPKVNKSVSFMDEIDDQELINFCKDNPDY